ncbi:AAA family ATPase [Bradyrhizobium jicamae]|uniref:AAA family ATPase n=1 Tax=Bradyrhizobium jicamae TaxID=280332 RepID=A0ABS5FB36_9BRAD|nr:adenylate/guanylate cyclase domain-containing protein [Bradyrhizobium jicamae]MBR0793994.1 AAA family ATPase [Bradyrhizobium jicamae]
MQCSRCNSQNRATNDYCEACGAPLGIACDSCGQLNGPTSHFCGRCSAALKPASIAARSQPWQQILSSLNAKGGERKRLTILFADIRNSTSVIDNLGDPELGLNRLQPVLDLMNEAVRRYDGIVNKSQGDGVMALFGAPQPHEDHPVRGCLAALAMQDEMKRLGDKDLQIRVGVHTGEVIVQVVEHGIYQTYDAAGANVHLANRLEQLAEAGAILVSKETYDGAKQFVEVDALGQQPIRGISTPVDVFRLNGLRPAPSSGAFRSGRRLSPLTGRTREASALAFELEEILKGNGRVVGIVGEAGIGKSRLCFQFAEDCRGRGIRVYEARVLAHGHATPFQPVLELLRDIFGIKTAEGADESRRRVLDGLARLPVSDHLSRVLLDFLGIADRQQAAVKLDPKSRKAELLSFVQTLVRSSSPDTATVVLIEDLHWIDAASEEFVEALADAVVGTPTLLVLNFRPGFSASLMQRTHYQQINILPLSPTDAHTIVQDYFGTDPSLALISRNIVGRAQGNPFFLEELMNALIERGDLEGEISAYRLTAGVDTIPLPATVQAVVAARIDRLDHAARQVLEIASVVGREIPIPLLELVSALPRLELSDAIGRLRRAELLYDVPPFEQRLIAFRHPLIQEVAYRSLLHARRRELHSSIASAIGKVFKARLDENASLLAYHFEQAGEPFKSAQWNMRSAVWVGANDPRQALRDWKKVRELLSKEASSAQTDYLKMMAAGQLVNFGWREGIPADEALVYFNEAKGLAISLRDMRASALIHAAYGRILANGGSADEYVDRIREAAGIADQGNDQSVRVTLKAIQCHALRLSGRMADALAMNVEAAASVHEIVEADRKMLGFDVEIWLIAMRGHTLVTMGRGAEARPLLDRILALDEGSIDIIHHAIPSFSYVDLAWLEGNADLAREHANRAFSLAMKSGNPYLRVYAQAHRGLAHSVAGRLTSAIEDLSEALSFARARKAGLENEARILADLAHIHMQNGEAAIALLTAEEAIEIARLRCTRVPECLARIVRGHLLIRGGTSEQVDMGTHELSQASELMKETGARIFESLLHGTTSEFTPNRLTNSG